LGLAKPRTGSVHNSPSYISVQISRQISCHTKLDTQLQIDMLLTSQLSPVYCHLGHTCVYSVPTKMVKSINIIFNIRYIQQLSFVSF